MGTETNGEQLKNPGKDKEHPGLKQHGNQVRFHIACAVGKIVQAIELHKGGKHGHQHDQDEYDFGHLVRHGLLRLGRTLSLQTTVDALIFLATERI